MVPLAYTWTFLSFGTNLDKRGTSHKAMLFTPHGVFNTLSNHQLKQLGKFPPFCVLDFITLSKKDEILFEVMG